MKRTITPLLAIPVLALGCGASTRQPAPNAAPVAVSIAHAESTALVSSQEAGGVVRARSTAGVASRMMAPILDVHVRPGDRVRRGDPVITLDSRETAANRAGAAATLVSAAEAARAAESEIRAAQAAVILARATHGRIRALRERHSATPQELDQAVATLDAADAHLSGARARLAASTAAREAAQAASDAATVASSYASLVAPFDGLVTERSVDPGSMANPGVPLLTIEDSTMFRLEVAVDEARAAQVAPGQTVDVQIDNAGPAGHWVPARVGEIARIDPTSHSFLVKLDLPTDLRLRSGLFGRARFNGSPRQTLAVPASAAVRRGQLTFVFTVEDEGLAKLQPVSPGVVVGDQIEILAGIREGERVITNPPASLSDGARVGGVQP